jgi:hypothetical protein
MIDSPQQAPQTGNGVLKRGLVIIILMVLCFALFIAGKRGVASVSEFLVQEHLDAWAVSGKLPDDQNWNDVEGYFSFAAKLDSGNPGLLQLGGKLYEWRYLMASNEVAETVQPQAAHTFSEKSLDYYRNSLQLRPTWPYAWLDITSAKLRFNQLDEEFQQAFSQTLRFGYWDTDIQKGLLPLGFQSLTLLEKDTRKAFWEWMKAVAEKRPKEVIAAAETHGKLVIVCVGIQGNEKIGRLCKKKGY